MLRDSSAVEQCAVNALAVGSNPTPGARNYFRTRPARVFCYTKVMRDYALKTVDAYITKASPAARPKLNELRAVILAAVPQIEESISWGQPYYRKDGLLVGFDYYKDYLRFGFGPSFNKELRQALEAKGYKTGGKTIQIRFDQPVPRSQITKIIKTQAKANQAKRKD